MKTRTSVIILATVILVAGFATAAKKLVLKTEMDKVSYIIGNNIGTQVGGSFKMQDLKLNVDNLIRGITDALEEKDPAMTPEEMQTFMMDFQKKMEVQMKEKMEKMKVDNLKEGEEFLAKNKKKKGVTTTASGLQYKVLKKGKGKVLPTPADQVMTHYKGTLLNGEKFDSSYDRGEPLAVNMRGGVIKGWLEALALMKEGDKWEVYIPSDLAYGERGSPPKIEPNSTLIFEIELVEIVKRDKK